MATEFDLNRRAGRIIRDGEEYVRNWVKCYFCGRELEPDDCVEEKEIWICKKCYGEQSVSSVEEESGPDSGRVG